VPACLQLAPSQRLPDLKAHRERKFNILHQNRLGQRQYVHLCTAPGGMGDVHGNTCRQEDTRYRDRAWQHHFRSKWHQPLRYDSTGTASVQGGCSDGGERWQPLRSVPGVQMHVEQRVVVAAAGGGGVGRWTYSELNLVAPLPLCQWAASSPVAVVSPRPRWVRSTLWCGDLQAVAHNLVQRCAQERHEKVAVGRFARKQRREGVVL
jgi:hypothetical protein